MADYIDTLITNPEVIVTATQQWIESNYVLLGTCAVGALAVAGGVGFGIGALRDRLKAAAEERKRFGGLPEAKMANLLRNPKLAYSGIPVGKIGRKYLCWIDQEPLLVTGGTRSGKGVGIIRPAMLTYGGPIVAYDGGKGELFRDTSGYRSRFSHVLNFDLTNPDGVHFNFLDEIDPANPVAGADMIATSVPKPSKSDGHFEPAADRLMGAVILHVLHGEPTDRKNMAEVVRLISQGDVGMRRIAGMNAHPIAVDRVTALFGGDVFAEGDDGSKYRQSVYNTALVRLSAFEDPVVAKVTSRSDFTMADIFRLSPSKRPVTLYLTTPANHDDRLRPVTSLFLSLLIGAIMRDQPALAGEPMTLLVIDEFASLRMEILQTAITKIVGCGATMLLGAQSLNALRQAPYGPYNQFRDNIRCHIAFAANDSTTQQDISQSCGSISEHRTSKSSSRPAGSWQKSHSETESEIDRPVISPGKVRSMSDEKELIIITGQPVIRANKIRDMKDPILKKRLKLPTAKMRDANGVYPSLPCPTRPSPWAAVAVEKPKPFLAAKETTTAETPDGTIVAKSETPAFPAFELTAPPVKPRKRKLALAPKGES